MSFDFISVAGKVRPEFNTKLNSIEIELEISDRNHIVDEDLKNYFRNIVRQYPDLAITEPQITGNKVSFRVATMLPEPFNRADADLMLDEFTGMHKPSFTLADKSTRKFRINLGSRTLLMESKPDEVSRYFASGIVNDEYLNSDSFRSNLTKLVNDTIPATQEPEMINFVNLIYPEVSKLSKLPSESAKEEEMRDFLEKLNENFKDNTFSKRNQYANSISEYQKIVDLEKENAGFAYWLLTTWYILKGDNKSASTFYNLAMNHLSKKNKY